MGAEPTVVDDDEYYCFFSYVLLAACHFMYFVVT